MVIAFILILRIPGVAIELSAPEFTQSEAPNATMKISILKNVILANPIFFRVIPLTADEAERQTGVAVPFNCPPDDGFSPCRAGGWRGRIHVQAAAIIFTLFLWHR